MIQKKIPKSPYSYKENVAYIIFGLCNGLVDKG